MKTIAIRFILTLLFLGFVYKETGPATVTSLGLILVAVEFINGNIRLIVDTLKEWLE